MAVVLLWSFKIDGMQVVINHNSDCDRSFDLNEHSEVIINFEYGVTINCRITANGSVHDDYPRMCVKPEKLNFGGCSFEVDVHNYIYIKGYEDKKYNCSTEKSDEICTYVDRQIIEFKRIGEYPTNGDIDIRLKLYSRKSEFDVRTDAPSWIIIICAVGGVLFLVCFSAILVVRVVKQRARFSRAIECRTAQPEFVPYPTVQYQPATQQVAGYQPSATGHHTYQLDQGVQSGFQPTNEPCTVYSDRVQNTPIASPEVNLSQPPPSYQQALEMQKRSGI